MDMKSPASDHDYQAEDDHRTLTRAEEVRGDKARMGGVKKHHRKVSKGHEKFGRTLFGGKR